MQTALTRACQLVLRSMVHLRTPHPRIEPGFALLHPLWWCMLFVLLLNDHLLKGSGLLHGAVTGKLSDVAGLVVAPMWIATLARLSTRRAIWATHVAVGAIFTLLNTIPEVTRGYVAVLSAFSLPASAVRDPTDLAALPMLWVSQRWLVRSDSEALELACLWRRVAIGVGLPAGLVGTVATSFPPPRLGVAGNGLGSWVYVSESNHLLVYDARTGHLHASPAIGNSSFSGQGDWVVLYEGESPDPKGSPLGLRAWNAREKVLVWTRPHDGGECVPTIRGDIVVMRCEARIIVRALRDGRRLWSQDGETYLGRADSAIIVTVLDQIAVRDAYTGEVLWRPVTGADSMLCLNAERIYLLTQGEVQRLGSRTGAVAASYPLPKVHTDTDQPAIVCPLPPMAGRVDPGLDAATEPQTPLVVSVGESSYVLAADSLEPLWQVRRVDRVVVATAEVLIVDRASSRIAYRAATGGRLWKDREFTEPATRSGPVMYTITHSDIRARDLVTGEELWTRDL